MSSERVGNPTPQRTIVFIGDSVTAADREQVRPLGDGYVSILAESNVLDPEFDTVENLGVPGDRVRDLRARIVEPLNNMVPALVSCMIGINDTWRRFDSDDPTSPEQFQADYEAILRTIDLDATRLVLLEPFLIPVSSAQRGWRADLDSKIQVVRHLARAFSADLVPADSYLNTLASTLPAGALAADGVHPTPLGHRKIAGIWRSTVGIWPRIDD